MSPRIARLLALPCALLALVLHLAQEVWISPRAWHLSADWGLLIYAAAIIVELGVPSAIYALIVRRAGKRPAAWSSAFLAEPSPSWSGYWVIFLAWWTVSGLVFERARGEDHAHLAPLDPVTGLVLVLSVAAVILALVLSIGNRPRLQLHPDGITVHGLVGRRRAGWDGLIKIHPERLHIDREFLNFTLWYYRAFPAYRAAIGTDAGARAVEDAYRQR
ncbi:PH domain-containing protein [Actinoplanes cyaneus]|uniref:PH domain-containing protein n=1 Tax=Actinoplanes cyaneus TaxID=52696 RepID=UPI001943952E|nr:PH domain-containing protein [Actinoplanes cyaneus]